MNLFIDNKSGSPIYDQIFTQMKSHILTGVLPEGALLPSIRALAKYLRRESFLCGKEESVACLLRRDSEN